MVALNLAEICEFRESFEKEVLLYPAVVNIISLTGDKYCSILQFVQTRSNK